jgi:hypothetical protein
MRDSELFDKAVGTFFKPLADRFGLPVVRVRHGIFDISSQHFIMRIRLHTGHHRGLNVILRPAAFRDFDENKPGNVLGITCFMEFHGESREEIFIEISTDEQFLELARRLAMAAERYAVPYLLGEGKDWEAVRKMVERKTQEGVEKIKNYPFLW